MEIGVDVEEAQFLPKLQNNESIAFQQPQTHVHLNDYDLGDGKLILGTGRVYWISTLNPVSLNFAIDYSSIGLHATCQDLESWPVPCLYCQLDIDLDLRSSISERLSVILGLHVDITGNQSQTSDSEDAMDSDMEPTLIELRFAPEDASSLTNIFSLFTKLSLSNVDSKSSDDNYENSLRLANGGNHWFTAENADDWNPTADNDDDDGVEDDEEEDEEEEEEDG